MGNSRLKELRLKSPFVAAALACVFVLTGVSSHSFTTAGLSAEQDAAITAIADRAMARQHIPGMAVGIGYHGTMVYARGFGMRGNGKAVDGNTIFPIGSITKQFTAACVMLLVQDGRVRLDSPIAHYLPGAPHGREITVRELLNQTSGLPDYSLQPALQRALHPHLLTSLTPATLIGYIASKPLDFVPGTKWEYSNTNYVLAGMLVQAVSREPYASFLRTRILEPFGLNELQYLRTSVAVGRDVSRGYKVVKGRFVMLPPFTMSWAASAGALASNVHDLLVWDDAFFGGRVVNSTLVQTATTPSRIEPDYAFGWVVDRVKGQRMIWHNGAFPGAHAMNAVFPQSGWRIVVLTNMITANPEGIAKEMIGVLSPRKR